MTTHTITEKVTMEVNTCPQQGCGVRYAIDSEYREDLRSKGGGYYCPNGHWLSWSESDADRARKRANQAERDRDYWRTQTLAEREAKVAAEHRERAQKAAKTRLKNRIANGVCPCCKRHFQNVERHIKNQHPEFSPADSHETERS